MARTSVQSLAAQALRADQKARAEVVKQQLKAKDGKPQLKGATADSFVNFEHKLGMGADNALSSSTYGFNPITRQRTLLEWIHRGSWLGGVAVNVIADDMTRAGVNLLGEMKPDDQGRLERLVIAYNVWPTINECITWGRLYGGAISVALLDGQDMRQPLRRATVGRNQFKGLITLDRWMVEPSLSDLVTDLGPNLGLPKYYRVLSNAPALRGQVIHYSRVMVRHVGVELPYQQRLTEQLWGESVLERLFDRMIAFDSASTGMAQLIHKSFLRTLKVKGLREVIASGGPALDGLTAYVNTMRRYQGIEGMSVIDSEDDIDVQQHQAMSGMADALDRFGQQVSGALQVPMTRLFGVSGGGLSGTNDSDMRLYYDSIKQRQMKDVHVGATTVYALAAISNGLPLPPDFGIEFRSLWELSDTDKANIAKTVGDSVTGAMDSGVIGRQTALKELRQASRRTGVYTNITEEMIAAADDDVGPPPGAEGMPGMPGAEGMPGEEPDPNLIDPKGLNTDETAGSQGQEGSVGQVPRRRAQLHEPAPGGGEAGR